MGTYIINQRISHDNAVVITEENIGLLPISVTSYTDNDHRWIFSTPGLPQFTTVD